MIWCDLPLPVGMDDGGRGVGGPLGAGKVRKHVLPRPSGKEYSCTDTLTEAVRPCQTSDRQKCRRINLGCCKPLRLW